MTEQNPDKLEVTNSDKLEFQLIVQPVLFHSIPRELFEQVEGSKFDIDQLYKVVPAAIASGSTLVYIMLDEDTKIRGVMWLQPNPLTKEMVVPVISVDKEFQEGRFGPGHPIFDRGIEIAKEVIQQTGLEPVLTMSTRHPKAFVKAGWEETGAVIMEMRLDDGPV